jgi:ferredoxin-NADP reductase/ferredoxin
MYKINLLTRDGATIAFDAEPEETLLAAAERANIYPPSSCRQGGCGVCRVTAVSGDITLDAYSEAALSARARAAGETLLCCAHAQSDVTLHAPYDQQAVAFAPEPVRRATVVALEPAGASAMRLQLQYQDDPEHGRAAQFLAGQFAELELPGAGVKRAYSVASTPNWDGALEFLVRLQQQGAFSTYLRERAAPGDELIVHGPKGQFTLDDASLAPRWFVCGGTGLAPALSMLRQMAEFADARACRLFFGVNRVEEVFARDAIDALRAALPQLSVTLCVWKPESDWRGFTGTPAEAMAQALAGTPEQPDIYVCGPPALIDAVTRAAAGGSGRVFCEQFAPA